MNNINSIVDAGRLHLAYNEHYQGSINSYNCCLTKFIFRDIFKKAIDVQIGDKIYCLNKNSLDKFYRGHNIQRMEDLTPKYGNGFMRNHLSASTVDALSRKLFHTVASSNDQNRANKLLRMGADPNRFYWYCNGSLTPGTANGHEYAQHLPKMPIPKMTAWYYSPFVMSMERWVALGEEMIRYGAQTQFAGQQEEFERKLSRIDHSSSVNVVSVLGQHHGRVRAHPGVNVSTHEIKTYIDSFTNRFTVAPRPLLNGNTKVQQPDQWAPFATALLTDQVTFA